MLWVPKTTSTYGAFAVIVARSFCARQPPTAICMPGFAALTGARWHEVAVELVVGVLPHRAGVEDDHVGLRRRSGRADVARVLQQPGEPLGVVDVHLAPVGADLVRARRHDRSRVPRGPTRPRRGSSHDRASVRRARSRSRSPPVRRPHRFRRGTERAHEHGRTTSWRHGATPEADGRPGSDASFDVPVGSALASCSTARCRERRVRRPWADSSGERRRRAMARQQGLVASAPAGTAGSGRQPRGPTPASEGMARTDYLLDRSRGCMTTLEAGPRAATAHGERPRRPRPRRQVVR